jgi:adenylyl- and sulfurtransferase ThiI
MTWEQALQFSEQSNMGSHDDWRMPNIKELFSLTSQAHSSPSIHPIFGITSANTIYWSSTTLSNQTDKAWYMDSRFGITTYAVKTQRLKVIAVRNALNVSSIEENSNQSIVCAHNDVISVKVHNPQIHIHIFDIIGNLIQMHDTQSNVWHSSSLSPGVYFIQIKDGDLLQSYKAVITP